MKKLALVIMAALAFSVGLVFGTGGIAYSISKPYYYQGTIIMDLNQYQKFAAELPNKQALNAIAYDPTTDKIMLTVTYNFSGKQYDAILYGIPSGTPQSFLNFMAGNGGK